MSIVAMSRMAEGQTGLISRIKSGGEAAARMKEMGLAPGAEIEIVGRAPFNDPLIIKLRGQNLILRNSEASRILVDTLPA